MEAVQVSVGRKDKSCTDRNTSETRASSGGQLLCNDLNHCFLCVLFHIFTDFLPLLFRAKVNRLSQLYASSLYMSLIYPGTEQTSFGATPRLDFVPDSWALQNNGQVEEDL